MFKKAFLQIPVLVVLMAVSLIQASAANTPIRVEKDLATLNLPNGIIFTLSVESNAEIKSVTLLYGTTERNCHEGLSRQKIPFDPAEKLDLTWTLDFTKSQVLPPGVHFWWQWEIIDASGRNLQTEKQTLTVKDQRHRWLSKSNQNLTVNWYEGSDSFGIKVLNIAVDGMRRIKSDMGIQFNEPIILTIYPNSNELKEILVYSQEWTGGVAFPKYNLILLAISPTDLAWAQESIPHELTHLVVEARIYNCRGVSLPVWLNEGLAVYAEGKTSSIDKQAVFQALMADELATFTSLANGFPAYSKEANLAYIQSGMVVEYLISTYGPEKMNTLLTVVQNGQTIDKAFREVYGFDTVELDSAWRQSLGFAPLKASHTTPEAVLTRTQVPTLALWTAPVQPGLTPTQQLTPNSPTPPKTLTMTPTIVLTPSIVSPQKTHRQTLIWIGGGIFLLLMLAFFGVIIFRVLRRKA
jgi:hypothetical protein